MKQSQVLTSHDYPSSFIRLRKEATLELTEQQKVRTASNSRISRSRWVRYVTHERFLFASRMALASALVPERYDGRRGSKEGSCSTLYTAPHHENTTEGWSSCGSSEQGYGNRAFIDRDPPNLVSINAKSIRYGARSYLERLCDGRSRSLPEEYPSTWNGSQQQSGHGAPTPGTLKPGQYRPITCKPFSSSGDLGERLALARNSLGPDEKPFQKGATTARKRNRRSRAAIQTEASWNAVAASPEQLSNDQTAEYPSLWRSDDMAAGFSRMSGDARRYPPSSTVNTTSSRPENRAPMINILCRNGQHCRKLQEGSNGAACDVLIDSRSSEAHKIQVPVTTIMKSAPRPPMGHSTCTCLATTPLRSATETHPSPKKSLNVESPAFTPNFTANTANVPSKRMGLSPRAAAAATFTPRGSGESSNTTLLLRKFRKADSMKAP